MTNFPPKLIRCPHCSGDLSKAGAGDDFITCKSCKTRYQARDAVMDLVPELCLKRTLAQAFMESPLIVGIYESRLWRRSPGFSLLTGISFDREAKVIVQAAKIGQADAVLDLACGPGIYTRPFARTAKKGHVVGLDLSTPMLSLAAAKAKKEHLQNVTFVRGNAMDLPFFDESFHAANCCGALHLFPDTSRALSEIHRVLSPGGRLTLAVFKQKNRLQAQLWKRFGGVRSYTPQGLDKMLRAAGFSDVSTLHAKGVWMIMSAKKG